MAKASHFLVLAAAVLACASLVVAQTPFFTVTHLGTVYNTNTQNTEFTYSIATSGADMQYWVLGANCSSPPALASGQAWRTYAPDASTGVTGFKYPHGQISGQTVQYTLLVTGKIGEGSVEWGAHGSGQTDTGSIAGPDCFASDAYPDMGEPTVEAVACDSESAVIPAEFPANVNYEKVPGACEHSYTLLKTTTETTDGLTSSRTDSINVSDDEKPSFQPTTLEHPVLDCTSELVLPGPATVTATDNCAHVEATMCSEVTNGTCPGNYFITHTWTATDDCGNSKCLTQVITVQDITKPDLHGVPASTTYECDPSEEEGRLTLPEVTATDDCNDCFNGPIAYTSMRVDGKCANTFTVERTWSVTDCCGNSESAKQVIVVSDNTPPTLSFTGPEPSETVTAECDDVPEPPAVTASDVCVGGAVDVTLESDTTPGSCPGVYTITRTWEAVDPCGNDASIVKYVSVSDNTPPTFTPSSYEDITAECGAIPAPPTPTATDNCGSVTITYSAHNETTDCDNEWDEVREWTATDECGLTSTLTQTVHVLDTTPPTPANLPANQTQQCAALIDPYVEGTATAEPDPNGCDAVLNITYNAVNDSHSCENRFTRIHTWVYKDCSHTVTEERYDFVHDDTIPEFSGVPADTTYECTGSDPADPTAPTATDNCDASVTVSGSKNRVDNCGSTYVETWTWTTEDQCSNANSAQTVVTVRDTTPPTVSGPNDDTVQCDAVPAVGTVTGSDDCSSVSVTYDGEERTNGSCDNQYTLVRTWTGTDACSLSVNHVQTIEVIDTTPPELSGVPTHTTADCSAVPSPADVCASDNCNGTSLTMDQAHIDQCGPGGYLLVRTWTVADNCGNTDSGVQTVTVTDTSDPVFAGEPTDATQECSATSEPATPTATDDCSALTISSHHTSGPGSCTHSTIRNIAFQATDDCSNTAWFNYTITILDTTSPVLQNVPAAATDECSDISTPATVTASDNCDDSVAPAYTSSDTSADAVCPGEYTITRTWTTTDDCGNSQSDSQVITVEDTTPPVWSSALPVASTTVDCEAPVAAVLTATDLCDPDVTVTFTNTTSGTCPEVITRKWVATDCASNSISFTQVITVQDINGPTISGVPADTTNQCDSVDVPANTCASDNCEHGVDLSFTQTREAGSCPFNYRLIRKWVAEDACTLTSTEYQTVTVEDTTAPSVSAAPADKTIQCNIETAIVAPTYSDNCGTVTQTAHHFNESGSCAQSWYERINFRHEDECTNVAWVNWTRFFQDTFHPTASWSSNEQDDSVDTADSCVLPAAPTITLTDNCDPAPTYTLTVTNVSDICDYKFSTERHWRWTDDCANTMSHTQTVTMTHITPPTLTCSTCNNYAGDQQCDQTFDDDSLTASDACGVDLTSSIVPNPSQTPGSCPQQYTINREWTVTDTCGLNTTITRSIDVVDTVAPVLTPTPSGFTTSDVCTVAPPTTVTATDNCDPSVSVSVSNVTTAVCDFNFTVVYTWSASDDCGNTASHSQTIKYINSDAPTMTEVTTQVTSECDTPVEVPVVTASDACSRELEVTYSATNTTGSCPNAWVEVRTWTATDDCGRTTSRTQTVTFSDNTPPQMTCPPALEQEECGFVQPPEVLTATDNCDGVTVSFAETRTNGSDCCTYELERVWTATDACGRSVSCTKTIVVRDTIPPPIDIPGDVNADCHNVPAAPTVTAHEAPLAVAYCANNSAPASCVPETLPANYQADGLSANLDSGLSVFVWQADNTAFIWAKLIDTDSNTYNLNITLAGRTTDAPSGFPVLDLDAECLEAAGIDHSHFKYYTAGSGNLSLTSGAEVVDFTVDGAQVGMSASNLGTSKGVFIKLSNGAVVRLALEKADDPSSPCDVSSITWALPSLECGDGADVSFTEERIDGSCPDEYKLRRTWTAWDTTGNSVSASSTVYVTDTAAPVLSGAAPNDYSRQCQELAAPSVTYTDLCDDEIPVSFTETKTDGSCTHRYTVNRLWQVSDDCGNTASVRQTVQVHDTIAPTLSEPPADGAADCASPPTTSGLTLTVSDNCDTDMPISETYSDSRAPGVSASCQTFDRTFTFDVADDCGNTDSKQYTVSVTDSTPPSFTAPAGYSVECDHDPIAPVDLSCTDDCGSCTISGGELVPEGHETVCPYAQFYHRTWTATDECGLTTAHSQTITVHDTTAPTFTDAPEDTTVECDNIPPPATVSGSDNCDLSVTVEYNQERIGTGSCSYVLERTWTARDCASNENSVVQRITVLDSAGPLFVEQAGDEDATVLCGEVPKPPPQCAQDNCNAVTMVFTETRNDGSCPYDYTLNRRWVATDGCGNPSTVRQVITVDDQVDPEWSEPLPASSTQECDSTSEPNRPSGTDACGSASVSDHHTDVEGSCTQARNKGYNWKLTDECGNAIWHNITVRVEDTNAPVFGPVPSQPTGECSAPTPTAPTVTDACDASPTVSHSSRDLTGTCLYDVPVEHTWTASDACGNVASTVATMTAADTVAPVLSNVPAASTFECDESFTVGSPTASDNCGLGSNTVQHPVDGARVDGSCPDTYQLAHKWTIQDDCGSVSSAVMTVQIQDTNPPAFSDVPASSTEQCNPPTPGSPTATDNCDTEVAMSHTASAPMIGSCPHDQAVEHTWTAEDDCGNSASVTRTMYSHDTVAPVLSNFPAASTFECQEQLPSDPTASDNCGLGENTVQHTVPAGSRIDGSCTHEYKVAHEWTIADECGNSDSFSMTLQVQDTGAPTLQNVPAASTSECSAPVPGSPSVTDDCDQDIDVEHTFNRIEGSCPNAYKVAHTWSVQDDCGNTASDVATMTSQDTIAPVLSSKPDHTTVQCDAVPAAAVVTATDNCDTVPVTYSFTEESNSNCQHDYRILRSWIATDGCGNSDSWTQTVTVIDTTNPSVSGVPADTSYECDSVAIPANACASDNCANVSLAFSQARSGDSCSYTLTRTWTATDECGNTGSDSQVVTVSDNTDPTWDQTLPADSTFECHLALYSQDTLTASDNCQDAPVTATEATTPGSCLNNYVKTYHWEAADGCGNSISYTQTITVQDTTPPVIQADLICIGIQTGLTNNPVTRYNDITKALLHSNESAPYTELGSFFRWGDLCDAFNNRTETHVFITGCTSNQDAAVGAAVVDGFSEDCVYDNTTDSLAVYWRSDTEHRDAGCTLNTGKYFVVTADVYDACGNMASVTKYLYSATPEAEDDKDCLPFNVSDWVRCKVGNQQGCKGDCRCEYNDAHCNEDGDSAPTYALSFTSHFYNSASDTTTFHYHLAGTGARPEKLTIALDLSQHELVSAHPVDWLYMGEHEDTYLNGLTWVRDVEGNRTLEVDYYSFTLAGNYGSDGQVAYQLTGDLNDEYDHAELRENCTATAFLAGPGARDSPPSADVAGTVTVGGVCVGTITSVATDCRLDTTYDIVDAGAPVVGAIVYLLQSPYDEASIVRVTMTDHDGSYSFSGVNITGLKVVLGQDGFLRDRLRTSAKFLVQDDTGAATWAYGEPVEASGSADFTLIIDSTAAPVYDAKRRDLPQPYSAVDQDEHFAFRGNPKTTGWWLFQLTSSLPKSVSQEVIDLAVARATAALGSCAGTPATLLTEDKAALATLALNIGAGYGVFEPYNVYQGFALKVATRVLCGAGATTNEQNTVATLLHRLNAAY